VTSLLAQVAISNLIISAVLAALAFLVHLGGRYPSLAHALWVLVLLKVVSPPLVFLPLLPGPHALTLAANVAEPVASVAGSAAWESLTGWLAGPGAAILVLAWAIGSGLVLAISIVRIRAFDRLVRSTSSEAPESIRRLAAEAARRLGLRSSPAISISSAQLSPLTWWLGGRVRIVLPMRLVQCVTATQLRWVLAHELAHVRRRDHLVRWLEWLACVAFWWNPVVWWARRDLRLAEEVACDALVVRRLGGAPRSYARALLAVIELLAGPATRSPSMATGIDAAETLERRFRRILSDAPVRRAPLGLVASVLVIGLSMMTVGLGSASDGPSWPARPTDGPQRDGTDPVPTDMRLLSAELETATGVLVRSDGGGRSTGGGRDVIGTARADRLSGTAGDDLLIGRSGSDELSAGGGNDVVRGGAGADDIRTGRGNDVVEAWRDGSPDVIDCGPGAHDRAVVDDSDTTEGCEVVIRRHPTAS
jgi:beta-lactamase regulating signal transducer with metallopeptidase domain